MKVTIDVSEKLLESVDIWANVMHMGKRSRAVSDLLEQAIKKNEELQKFMRLVSESDNIFEQYNLGTVKFTRITSDFRRNLFSLPPNVREELLKFLTLVAPNVEQMKKEADEGQREMIQMRDGAPLAIRDCYVSSVQNLSVYHKKPDTDEYQLNFYLSIKEEFGSRSQYVDDYIRNQPGLKSDNKRYQHSDYCIWLSRREKFTRDVYLNQAGKEFFDGMLKALGEATELDCVKLNVHSFAILSEYIKSFWKVAP